MADVAHNFAIMQNFIIGIEVNIGEFIGMFGEALKIAGCPISIRQVYEDGVILYFVFGQGQLCAVLCIFASDDGSGAV